MNKKSHRLLYTSAFTCTFPGCTKSFRKKSEVERHVLTHSGDKPFVCTDCSKSFKRKDHLQRHDERFHSAVEGRGDSFKSFQYNIKDESEFTDFKSENEYRESVKEFNNELGDRQRDVPEVLKQLGSRIETLKGLGEHFSTPNADMLLLKTKLLPEIKATQNDLSDANNQGLLMNDRASIKDKYRDLKLRNKEMENSTKKIEENVRRDTAYNKMSNNFEDLKNRFNQVVTDAERLKVIFLSIN